MELDDSRKMRRHQDQIFSRENNDSNDEGNLARERSEEWSRKPVISEMDVQLTNDMKSDAVPVQEHPSEAVTCQYPARERRRPGYYGQN